MNIFTNVSVISAIISVIGAITTAVLSFISNRQNIEAKKEIEASRQHTEALKIKTEKYLEKMKQDSQTERDKFQNQANENLEKMKQNFQSERIKSQNQANENLEKIKHEFTVQDEKVKRQQQLNDRKEVLTDKFFNAIFSYNTFHHPEDIKNSLSAAASLREVCNPQQISLITNVTSALQEVLNDDIYSQEGWQKVNAATQTLLINFWSTSNSTSKPEEK